MLTDAYVNRRGLASRVGYFVCTRVRVCNLPKNSKFCEIFKFGDQSSPAINHNKGPLRIKNQTAYLLGYKARYVRRWAAAKLEVTNAAENRELKLKSNAELINIRAPAEWATRD